MFKLERVIDADHIVFRVSGRIEFEHVATIEQAIAGENGPTVLDLSDVILVDRDVVPCLARLKNAGVALENCPAYVRQAIRRSRRPDKTRINVASICRRCKPARPLLQSGHR